jgi:hypothetical protein
MKPYPNFRDVERLTGITWHSLVKLEPRLEELLLRAQQGGVRCRSWSDVARVFLPIRNTLVDLVGFAGHNHRHPVLGSTGAYEVAYWRLYDAVAGLLPEHAGATEAQETQHWEAGGENWAWETAGTVTAGV